jgi:hypothetical protein
MNRITRGLIAGALTLTVGQGLALAQTAADAAPLDTTATPPAEPTLTPEEQAEIDAATGADATAAAKANPPPAEPAAGGAPGVQSFNPDLAVILDVALAAFSDDAPLQDGAHDPHANGFTLQQVELSFSHNVDPYLRFDSNIVFNDEEVDVEEAYATTLALPHALQVRAGKFLTRFGRINPTHPHSWDFVDQPFALSRVFGGENNRGLGTEVSWISPLPWYVEVVGSVNHATGDETDRSFYGATDPGVHGLRDFQYTAAVKQFFDLSDNWSLLWGLSGATGPNDSGTAMGIDETTQLYGTDVYLKYRPITHGSSTIVSLQGEYIARVRHVPGDTLVDHSLYAYLFWRFAQRWAAAGRYELGTPEDGDLTAFRIDPDWTENRQRVTANLTFWPSEFSRFRLQGSVDSPGWLPDPIWAAMLSAEFVVGAHGAHKF